MAVAKAALSQSLPYEMADRMQVACPLRKVKGRLHGLRWSVLWRLERLTTAQVRVEVLNRKSLI